MGSAGTESLWSTWVDRETLVMHTAGAPVRALQRDGHGWPQLNPKTLPWMWMEPAERTLASLHKLHSSQKLCLWSLQPQTSGSDTCHLPFPHGHCPVYMKLKFAVSICFLPVTNGDEHLLCVLAYLYIFSKDSDLSILFKCDPLPPGWVLSLELARHSTCKGFCFGL